MLSVGEPSSRYREALLTARQPDGGFGPRVGLPSEPEPTALAAIALDDADARMWLEAHQRVDGRFVMELGAVENDSATPLAAIALEGSARERALDAVVRTRAARFPSTVAVPYDTAYRGWPWTLDTFGWTEPTARAVLALRLLRPDAAAAIDDGLGVLRNRECVGGGWNYGNRVVLGVDLPPYTQTTAMALLALQRSDEPARRRGLERLRHLWREERSGGISLAVAAAALRTLEDADVAPVEGALADAFGRSRFLGDVAALGWAAIATGEALERLVIAA
jgi:hypothetical protein